MTPEERKALYKAIEAVLPVEARREAADARKSVEAREDAMNRLRRDAEKQQERDDRERSRPLVNGNFMVAGVSFEGRGDVVAQYVQQGDQVYLVRDPQNAYSRCAVEVRLQNGFGVGFVPEEDAQDFAPLLDQGCLHYAVVTKVLNGGRVPIPVVKAQLFRPDAAVTGLVHQNQCPPKRAPSVVPKAPAFVGASKRPQASGCVSVLIFGLLAAAMLVAFSLH